MVGEAMTWVAQVRFYGHYRFKDTVHLLHGQRVPRDLLFRFNWWIREIQPGLAFRKVQYGPQR